MQVTLERVQGWSGCREWELAASGSPSPTTLARHASPADFGDFSSLLFPPFPFATAGLSVSGRRDLGNWSPGTVFRPSPPSATVLEDERRVGVAGTTVPAGKLQPGPSHLPRSGGWGLSPPPTPPSSPGSGGHRVEDAYDLPARHGLSPPPLLPVLLISRSRSSPERQGRRVEAGMGEDGARRFPLSTTSPPFSPFRRRRRPMRSSIRREDLRTGDYYSKSGCANSSRHAPAPVPLFFFPLSFLRSASNQVTITGDGREGRGGEILGGQRTPSLLPLLPSLVTDIERERSSVRSAVSRIRGYRFEITPPPPLLPPVFRCGV